MILPIVAHGHPVLKKVGEAFTKDDPGLPGLIEDMFETMYASSGVGLAGPQVNQSKRIFVIDATPYADEGAEANGFKKVFINPLITSRSGKDVTFEEGCLSYPGIRENVVREDIVRVQYYDEHFNFHDEEFSGILSRIIQHEYDHIEGVVFIDRISKLRKTLLRRKLVEISEGQVDVDYRMIFPKLRKAQGMGRR